MKCSIKSPKIMIFIEENFEFPMNLFSMLLYDGGLVCIEQIEMLLEKLLVSTFNTRHFIDEKR